MNYFIFIRESLSFSLSFVVNKLLGFLIFAMYGISSNIQYSGQIDLVIGTLEFLSSGIRNFQKPINIICGPFYSQGDFYNYRVRRNQLIIINVFLYLCFLLVFTFLDNLYKTLGVKQENLAGIMFQSYLYIFVFKPLITISNFLQGIQIYFSLLILKVSSEFVK
jgi:hypothetical protein